MALAHAQARRAMARGEVPVGAVITDAAGTVIAARGNEVEAARDVSAHAEMLALRDAASRLGTPRLTEATLHVTLEPCPMCAAALVHFRIRRVVFGAYDPKGGGVEHGPRIFDQPGCLHRPEVVGGVNEQANAELLQRFFAQLRAP